MAIVAFAAPAPAWETRDAVPGRVIDGDTFDIAGPDRVRLLGVDAPEWGEPLSREAADFLSAELAAGPLALAICQERDKYGRLLAMADAGRGSVNLRMLEQGLARPLLIPPCGNRWAGGLLKAAARGFSASRGLYSRGLMESVASERASSLIGRRGAVVGKILGVGGNDRATYLNFGTDWRTDFTAVIFKEGLRRFSGLSLDPGDLAGRMVAVIGNVAEYNGPEIEVWSPEQVLPLDETGKGVLSGGPR